MKRQQLLKVLNSNMTSPYQDFPYKVGEVCHCTDIDMDKSICCSNGFYAVDIEGLTYAYRPDRVVYLCEVWGKSVEIDQYKRRYGYIKLLREVPIAELKKMARAWQGNYDLYHALFPINPFKVTPKINIDQAVELLKKWDSAWDSVWDSVWDSAWDSVGASVWASVWDSVWDSVWTSVGASVWDSVRDLVWDSVRASVRALVWTSVRALVWDSVEAYTGSLFTTAVPAWQKEYPFQSAVDLWKAGYVASFDGATWRLHTSKDAKIVWEGGI